MTTLFNQLSESFKQSPPAANLVLALVTIFIFTSFYRFIFPIKIDKRYVKAKFFLVKSLSLEIISLSVSIFITYVTIMLVTSGELILLYASALFIVLFIFVIKLKGKDQNFFYLALYDPGEKSDWIGIGNFNYTKSRNAFRITDSYDGMIYSKALLWTDYRFSCMFKIENSSVNLIVRASNTKNYVMLQIFEKSVKYHVRAQGAWWIPMEPKLPTPLSVHKWYSAEITCEGTLITLRIMDQGLDIYNFTWDIQIGSIQTFSIKDSTGKEARIKAPVNVDYGTIGFRNCSPEDAYVKDVYVQKLSA